MGKSYPFFRKTQLFLPFLLFLAACTDDAELASENLTIPGEHTVEIFKSTGSVQCEPGSGYSLGQMLAELNNQDIEVYTAACGVMTGVQFIAMCGAGDGNINVFAIDQADLAAARELGFAITDELPGDNDGPLWQLKKCTPMVADNSSALQ